MLSPKHVPMGLNCLRKNEIAKDFLPMKEGQGRPNLHTGVAKAPLCNSRLEDSAPLKGLLSVDNERTVALRLSLSREGSCFGGVVGPLLGSPHFYSGGDCDVQGKAHAAVDYGHAP